VNAAVVQLETAPYRLRLGKPFAVSGRSLDAREGFLVRVHLDDGRVGIGDVAPLPGWSRETLADARQAIDTGEAGCPSVDWALSAATFDARRSVEADKVDPRVASAVLAESGQDVPADASVVKLKVGRRSLEADLDHVRSLAARLGPASLRLDGNRRLTAEDTLALADAAGDTLAFLEEPVPAPLLEPLLARVPIALDETLFERASPPRGARAWVLKPTTLGDRTQTLAEQAGREGVELIISSALETDVGLRALHAFAAVWAPAGVHGLDTAKLFAERIDLDTLRWETRWTR